MRGYNCFVAGTACLGGFLFGYYMAIISGAIFFISSHFQFSLAKESAFVSILLLGALLGSSIGGYLTDRLGRKKVFLLSSSILVLGTLFLMGTGDYFSLMFARTIQGLGIGIISVAVPLYLAEISSDEHRGSIVSAYQLVMGLGILTAYIVNYLFTPTQNWHAMFLIGIIPAFVQAVCVFFIPESPLWLLRKKKKQEALASLERLQLSSPHESTKDEKIKVRPRVLKFVLIIGAILSAFQQITGINTVIYYAPKIFQEAGYTSHLDAVLATVSLGIINLIGSLVSLWLLDKVGRKKLLLVGIMGMIISLMTLSLSSFYQFAFLDVISIASLIVYIFFFAIGLGPVTWVLLSEIFPSQIRDKAMSLAVFVNWLCVYAVLWAFPYLLDWIHIEGTFGIYSLTSVIAFIFVYKYFPETKKKSLSQISSLFDKMCD